MKTTVRSSSTESIREKLKIKKDKISNLKKNKREKKLESFKKR